jgi:hypothetical protein
MVAVIVLAFTDKTLEESAHKGVEGASTRKEMTMILEFSQKAKAEATKYAHLAPLSAKPSSPHPPTHATSSHM